MNRWFKYSLISAAPRGGNENAPFCRSATEAAKHVLAEHDEQGNSSTPYVSFACRCSRSSNIVDDNVGVDRSKQTAMKTAVDCTARLGWKTTRDEELEQSRRALPKNLIRPLPYRIAKASGSGDLLSRSPVHAGTKP
jgi:hypothetical protein